MTAGVVRYRTESGGTASRWGSIVEARDYGVEIQSPEQPNGKTEHGVDLLIIPWHRVIDVRIGDPEVFAPRPTVKPPKASGRPVIKLAVAER